MSMTDDSSESYEDDKVVEKGPNGTYLRFDHKLGSGAFKTVYRALDTERGIEVAWNQVLTDRVQLDKEKVLREIEFFKKIRHKHIIEFYNFWTTKNQVVFITELMPSGTLTDYIQKCTEVKLKIIKSWCKQILLGLNYLHTQEPPIIHRDIKCGNIFINGTTEGEVKIGDLGLATFSLKKDALSVIGTPEFMAPEYYNEVYTTSVDIWAFGMAMIEMVTLQCPYAECDNVGQIFKKVSGGIRPQQLNLILDPKVKEFISLCLADEDKRPTASQLLEHPFFSPDQENDNEPVKIGNSLKTLETNDTVPTTTPIQIPLKTSPTLSPERGSPTESELNVSTDSISLKSDSITSPPNEESTPQEESSVSQFDMIVVDREGDVLEVKAQIGIETDQHKEKSEIDFSYNLAQDSPKAMALDMVRCLELQPDSYDIIYEAFEKIEQNYSKEDELDREKTLIELSELVSLTDGDDISIENDNNNSKKTSTTASPESTRRSLPSDSETNSNTVTDLEYLVEDGDLGSKMTVPPPTGDLTDLEDLLDGEDSGDDNSLGSLLEDNTAVSQTGSDANTSSDEQEIEALKLKHERAMQALLKHQEDELRSVTERHAQRKLAEEKREAETNTSFDDTPVLLRRYYERKAKKNTSNLTDNTNSLSPLYI